VSANNLTFLSVKQGGNLDVALGVAQRAKQPMPQLNPVTDTPSWVVYSKGDYASALALFRVCFEKEPNFPEHRYHLDMVLTAVGPKERAKDELESALRLSLVGEKAEQPKQVPAGN
jgi:hypothetical protein